MTLLGQRPGTAVDVSGAVKLRRAWAEMRCTYAATRRSSALSALVVSGLVKVRACVCKHRLPCQKMGSKSMKEDL